MDLILFHCGLDFISLCTWFISFYTILSEWLLTCLCNRIECKLRFQFTRNLDKFIFRYVFVKCCWLHSWKWFEFVECYKTYKENLQGVKMIGLSFRNFTSQNNINFALQMTLSIAQVQFLNLVQNFEIISHHESLPPYVRYNSHQFDSTLSR